MKRNTILMYVGGALLTAATIGYVIYLLGFLVKNLSVISGTDLLKTPEIATFDLEKFKEIKKAQ
ncbi:MAG: hypothetical protein AAB345_04895 [Patescibacteria group bacterium]